MRSKIIAVKKILKREGFLGLVKETIKHYVFIFFLLPLFFIKTKKFFFKNLNELLNFIYNTSMGYFAPLQVRSEITNLLDYFKHAKPKIIMEIGTALGGTLFCFTRTAPSDSLIISLDMPRRRKDMPIWKRKIFKSFALGSQKIYLVRGDSHQEETFQKIRNILGNEKIDFLFVDGDHRYEGVKNDFQMYGQLVKDGGIVAFHDIALHPVEANCGAHKFWNEIKSGYEYKEFIENKNQNWAGIGMIKIRKNK